MVELNALKNDITLADIQAPLAPDTMRDVFLQWLSVGNAKKFSPFVCVSCLDTISEYILHKKIYSVSLWDITQHNIFKPIYMKVMDAKLLRITDRNAYKVFIVAGQLYLRFLKEKPWKITTTETVNSVTGQVLNNSTEPAEQAQTNHAPTEEKISPVQTNTVMTIKDAVIHVLKSELRPMTVEEIYGKIVEQELYTFGAQNPVNVVRNTIEYACENSGYSNRNAVLCFRFERNNEGKKVYSLLTMNTIDVEIVDSEAVHIKRNDDSSAYAPQKVSDDEFEAICTCLVCKYSNGFRYDSQIELNKLRRYLSDYCGIELALSDAELSNVAKSCGTIFEDKVYVVNTVTRDQIKSLAERYFDNGGQAIFYEAFFSKHEHWLIESSVVSEEMLITLFRRLFPQYFFTTTYFGTLSENINTIIVSEMLRVWDYDILLNYDELSERLVYIPRYRIEFALGQNGEFVWNSTATFTHTSKIDISDSEKANICAMVAKVCNIERFVSFADLPLYDIAKCNAELTETAIHTSVYQICLADDYERSGKIITRRGDGLSALEIITAHCRTLDRATLQELLDFEKELTGEVHRWVPMQAGYDAMVRISEDDYIAEKYIHFNIPEIDAAIESFMMGEYIPLRAVTTFALFPHCGQPWNLFLLESYARRFSVNFGFDTPSVNNKNAGCIVRKHSKLTYDDIMVDVILKTNVPLTIDDVADYLFNNGYRGSRQKSKVSELIRIAKQLRERRN